ncbi:hypothetical protein [Saccharopolyspora pogona]|uniref:hypothetical protein n=1 Tax=Saccharopolyspora pogona TaxID=333966 RepID=UPI00168907BC|nr:hypothetical protein [Saccharopolyspora pogona]
MIAAWFAFVLAVLAVLMSVAAGGYFDPGKHAGANEGALTVEFLLERAAAESLSGGRHRRHQGPPVYDAVTGPLYQRRGASRGMGRD